MGFARLVARGSVGVIAISFLAGALAPTFARAQAQLDDTPEAFGQALRAWAEKNNVTRAIVVVRRNGKIVYKSKIGGADPDAAYHLFSLSKAITAACIATLIRDGMLTFETTLATGLAKFFKMNGRPADPRIEGVTVAQLLTHRAGFSGNRDKNDAVTGTNLTSYLQESSAREVPRPALLARAFQMKLLRAPGTEFVYGNTAYLALGTVIEELTDKPYDSYCRDAVLKPVGVSGELEPTWRVMSSFGGWRMKGADYLSFLDYFDPVDQRLGKTAKAWMLSDATKEGGSHGAWYALGTNVRKYGNGVNVWHWGSWRQSGAVTFAARWYDGTAWFVAASPHLPEGDPRLELDRALVHAYRAVRRWD